MRTITQPEPTLYLPDRGTVEPALTSEDVSCAAAAHYLYFDSMKLLARDVEILRLVSRFSQLTGAHIDALVFGALKAERPSRRAMKRLTDEGLLARVPGRVPGGELGGSPAHTYQIGPEGWRMFWTGRYRPARTINLHTLAIADTYTAVKQAERDGWLDVLNYASEPDSWENVAGADLRPDLYLDLGHRTKRERLVYFIEVDLGTERQKQILEKVERYTHAFNHSHQYPLDVFPSVLLLAIDQERKQELEQILRRVGGLPDGLFEVALLSQFPQMLM